jgi:hypothetical protein
MTHLTLFLVNVIIDVLAVLFVQNVTAGRRFRAGLVSVMIVILSYYSVICIVQDTLCIIPTALGAFVGTVITVKHKAEEDG